MPKKTKRARSVFEMYARRTAKSLLKTGFGFWSHLRSSPQPLRSINKIYVLMYHRINNYRKNELSVPVPEFRKQIAWLKTMGFQNMRMRELESLAPLTTLNVPKVIFSFDDGYEDNFYEALPVLKEFGYSAIFYIAPGPIGKTDMYPRDISESNRIDHNKIMGWQQIKRIHQAGMEIGSHTLSHQALTRMTDAQARKEITESKTRIEEVLGDAITSFCYPGGHFNANHMKWVEEAGYRSACTTEFGWYHGGSLFKLPRISVLASDNFFVFKEKLTGSTKLFKWIS